MTLVVCMTNKCWYQSNVYPSVCGYNLQFSLTVHPTCICILILFKLYVQCFACIYMVLRGKNAINWQIWNSNMLFHWDGKKRSFKRDNFLESIKLFADEQKPILPCTENKNPCPLVTVPSSMCLHVWVMPLGTGEAEKGTASTAPQNKPRPSLFWSAALWGRSLAWSPVSGPCSTSSVLPTGITVVRVHTLGAWKLEL